MARVHSITTPRPHATPHSPTANTGDSNLPDTVQPHSAQRLRGLGLQPDAGSCETRRAATPTLTTPAELHSPSSRSSQKRPLSPDLNLSTLGESHSSQHTAKRRRQSAAEWMRDLPFEGYCLCDECQAREEAAFDKKLRRIRANLVSICAPSLSPSFPASDSARLESIAALLRGPDPLPPLSLDRSPSL